MSKQYPQIKAGQKVDLDWRKDDYKIACCDCNLVHRFRFAVVGDKLRIRAWRDNRSTGQLRRWRKPSHHEQVKELSKQVIEDYKEAWDKLKEI